MNNQLPPTTYQRVGNEKTRNKESHLSMAFFGLVLEYLRFCSGRSSSPSSLYGFDVDIFCRGKSGHLLDLFNPIILTGRIFSIFSF